MKTFQQLRNEIVEASSNMSDLESSMKKFANQMKPNLKGIAKKASETINPEDVKNTVTTTVIDKLTGGQTGREKMVKKVGDTFQKASDELPNAMARFNDFLKSGKIEKDMNHLSSKFSSIANAGRTNMKNMKKEIKST
tara:strand:+ start:438 stop:851 length:414 start_codon:yes stop_codon:yes gene_type:complete